MIFVWLRNKVAFVLLFAFCTFLFAHLIAMATAETYARHDPVVGGFYVAVHSESSTQEFDLVPLAEANRGARSLFVAPRNSTVEAGSSEFYEYRARMSGGLVNAVETVKRSDDYKVLSVYAIESGRVVPLERRVMGPSHAILGMLLSFVFCKAIGLSVRRCRHASISKVMAEKSLN